MMKASAWLFAATMSAAGLALAQSEPTPTVTESTDPAKIAEIERHAQELAARSQSTPAMGEQASTDKRATRQPKAKSAHKRATKPKAAQQPMATDAK